MRADADTFAFVLLAGASVGLLLLVALVGVTRIGWRAPTVAEVTRALGVALLLEVMNRLLLWAVGANPAPSEWVEAWRGARHPAAIVLALCLASPLIEESLFRGLLQPALVRRMPVPAAIGATTLLFVAAHGPEDLVTAVGAALGGLGYGWLRARDGATTSAIVAHAAGGVAMLLTLITAPPTAGP